MHRTARGLATTLVALAVATTLLVGCGDDDRADGVATEASVEDPSDGRDEQSPEGSSGQVEGEVAPDLGSRTTGIGTLLVDADRRTLYTSIEDGELTSSCTDGCTETWPPYLVETEDVIVANGVDSDLVTTFEREDGTLQLAMDGHPLYRYAGDAEPTDHEGQGVGGIWFVVGPDGSVADDGNLTIDTHGDIFDY